MTDQIQDGPLSLEETEELDSYGLITGQTPLPPRALALWSRELYWGRNGMVEDHSLLTIANGDARDDQDWSAVTVWFGRADNA